MLAGSVADVGAAGEAAVTASFDDFFAAQYRPLLALGVSVTEINGDVTLDSSNLDRTTAQQIVDDINAEIAQ